MIYDVIIIGAGISGLYSAYLIKKYYPEKTFLILEENKKKYIGGRIHTEIFNRVEVVCGAGIGRKDKDTLLINLLKELNLEYKEFIVEKEYSDTFKGKVNIIDIIKKLKEEYTKNKEFYNNNTFKKFSEKILGKKLYKNFVETNGYSDFEKEDVYNTLYNYGFEDNLSDWTALSIPWKKMIQELINIIDIKNIKTLKKVTKIENNNNLMIINTENGNKYKSNKIIIGVTINSIIKLLNNNIYNQIGGQSFLRVYGKFSKSSINIINSYVKNTTIVGGLIYKIISINAEKGIYMICYNDNNAADILSKYIQNNQKNKLFWCNMIEKSLGIKKDTLKLINIKGFYWNIGTHYYKPLKNKYKNIKEFIKIAQNPSPNIFVVGEMISTNQGWTEGALESVKKIIKDI